MTRGRAHDLWRRFVNPDYVDLLEAFDFGRTFVRAEGAKLFDEDGREYMDFLAGFGVHNIGHNHPRLLKALRECPDSHGPSMLNIDAPLQAGLLAEKLASITHPELCRTAFANSGSEDATDLPVPWEVVAAAMGSYDPGEPPDFTRHILPKREAPS